jgi:hypothetical protein
VKVTGYKLDGPVKSSLRQSGFDAGPERGPRSAQASGRTGRKYRNLFSVHAEPFDTPFILRLSKPVLSADRRSDFEGHERNAGLSVLSGPSSANQKGGDRAEKKRDLEKHIRKVNGILLF